MDSNNAAKYVGRAPKTLAMWRMQGIGPEWTKNGGRVFYNKEALDAFMRGKAA
ncbi:MAG: DNA-binding protein [Proteobacteria bacterium]|nr:DNA-binding protein [Pseudomonadota bacterium]